MQSKTSINDCKIVNLPVRKRGKKGTLAFVYNNEHIPFAARRVYYLYDVPSDSKRGGHAHKMLQQLIVAASGSFNVKVRDGRESREFTLNKPYLGLYIPTQVWRELRNFSSGSICLVLASMPYDEADYIRDYTEFIKFRKSNK